MLSPASPPRQTLASDRIGWRRRDPAPALRLVECARPVEIRPQRGAELCGRRRENHILAAPDVRERGGIARHGTPHCAYVDELRRSDVAGDVEHEEDLSDGP